MKKNILLALFCIATGCIQAANKEITLRIIQTSDVHGYFFPYDFMNGMRPQPGSMARISGYVNELRKTYGERLILLDNGDILQGQPTSYYYNFMDTTHENIAASVVNYLKYDAQTVGNHDIEPGHAVYDKWAKEVRCPLLAANVVDAKTRKPYFKPYAILNKGGAKIAVIGMLTPAIPSWLAPEVWAGLDFEEMVTCAKKWIKVVKEKEKPDLIIGLFHSGREGGIKTERYTEDASLAVAREVDGFDLIMFGHDHTPFEGKIKANNGREILCIDPSCHAKNVSDVTVKIKKRNGKVISKSIEGHLTDVTRMEVDPTYMAHFEPTIQEIKRFVTRKVGECDTTISSKDAFFGSAAFTDMIHELQLKHTGADISFNAPLMFNATISKGDILVSDLFNLYKYENQIYVLKMTGKEIRDHLEMSYDLWCNTMKTPEDHIMLLNQKNLKDQQKYGFQNMTFNFDSAAGIKYTVDVTKPNGQKVKIISMADGTPFVPEKWYKVVMNSYRGNGGGELLTRGAGIPKEDLGKRCIYQSPKDQRYYLMQMIEKAKIISPKALNNWQFIPQEWTQEALKRDRKLIFGD